MKRIPSLDGVRAISIIMVVLFHFRFSINFPHYFDEIAGRMNVGVTFFFVISGFLITYLLLNEQKNYGRINISAFYVRRIFRILPVFILYTSFILIFNSFKSLGVTSKNIFHVFTFTENFEERPNQYFLHFWSLSVEEQFYLFWPAVFLFFNKHLKKFIIPLIAYSCIARVLLFKYPMDNVLILAGFFKASDAILIGALGAILIFETPGLINLKVLHSLYFKVLCILCILLFTFYIGHLKIGFIAVPFGNLIISISILCLMIPYLEPRESVIYKILNSRILTHIGVLSYSIYVWQQFFIAGPTNSPIWIFPFNIAVVYIVALLSYYLWEKQFLKLRKFVSVSKALS